MDIISQESTGASQPNESFLPPRGPRHGQNTEPFRMR